MKTSHECQWTECRNLAAGIRTDGTFRKYLCERHLALTSRKPHVLKTQEGR